MWDKTLIKTYHPRHTHATLLDMFWRISQFVTDDAIAKLQVTRFSQIEGNGRKYSINHIELSTS